MSGNRLAVRILLKQPPGQSHRKGTTMVPQCSPDPTPIHNIPESHRTSAANSWEPSANVVVSRARTSTPPGWRLPCREDDCGVGGRRPDSCRHHELAGRKQVSSYGSHLLKNTETAEATANVRGAMPEMSGAFAAVPAQTKSEAQPANG